MCKEGSNFLLQSGGGVDLREKMKPVSVKLMEGVGVGLLGLLADMEREDKITFFHQVGVLMLYQRISETWLVRLKREGCDQGLIDKYRFSLDLNETGALSHDIGKMGVVPGGDLDASVKAFNDFNGGNRPPELVALHHLHPTTGDLMLQMILREAGFSQELAGQFGQTIRTHHERYKPRTVVDGRGSHSYPRLQNRTRGIRGVGDLFLKLADNAFSIYFPRSYKQESGEEEVFEEVNNLMRDEILIDIFGSQKSKDMRVFREEMILIILEELRIMRRDLEMSENDPIWPKPFRWGDMALGDLAGDYLRGAVRRLWADKGEFLGQAFERQVAIEMNNKANKD